MADPTPNHNCLHEQHIGRFLHICNTEIPEIKAVLHNIYASLEGNGQAGLKTRTALLEDNVKDLHLDVIAIAPSLPCAVRKNECVDQFDKVKSRIKLLDEKLSSPKRLIIQASILTASGFAGGFAAMWGLAKFYLPDLIETKLPVIVKQILPEFIK